VSSSKYLNLLRNKKPTADAPATADATKATDAADATSANTEATETAGVAPKPKKKGTKAPNPKAFTPKKGHATPKRKDVERERGINTAPAEAPESYSEMRRRRKELKASMTKEEYKAYKKKEREQRNARNKEIQDKMDAGEEKYLLERDRGPERRFLRNWVDSRHMLSAWLMPVMLVLLVFMFIGTRQPMIANTASIVGMVIMLVFLAEGIYQGRRAARAVREHFPDTNLKGWSLGFYAWTRASQPRRLRTPKPQVEAGTNIE